MHTNLRQTPSLHVLSIMLRIWRLCGSVRASQPRMKIGNGRLHMESRERILRARVVHKSIVGEFPENCFDARSTYIRMLSANSSEFIFSSHLRGASDDDDISSVRSPTLWLRSCWIFSSHDLYSEEWYRDVPGWATSIRKWPSRRSIPSLSTCRCALCRICQTRFWTKLLIRAYLCLTKSSLALSFAHCFAHRPVKLLLDLICISPVPKREFCKDESIVSPLVKK